MSADSFLRCQALEQKENQKNCSQGAERGLGTNTQWEKQSHFLQSAWRCYLNPSPSGGNGVSGMWQAMPCLVQSPHLPSMVIELPRKSRSGTRSQDVNDRVMVQPISEVADPIPYTLRPSHKHKLRPSLTDFRSSPAEKGSWAQPSPHSWRAASSAQSWSFCTLIIHLNAGWGPPCQFLRLQGTDSQEQAYYTIKQFPEEPAESQGHQANKAGVNGFLFL